MHIIPSSSESSSYSLVEWLDEAVALVQRVNARLQVVEPQPSEMMPRVGRNILTDHRCLVLAALADSEMAA